MKRYTVHVILDNAEKLVYTNASNPYQASTKAVAICENKGYAAHDVHVLFVEEGWT